MGAAEYKTLYAAIPIEPLHISVICCGFHRTAAYNIFFFLIFSITFMLRNQKPATYDAM